MSRQYPVRGGAEIDRFLAALPQNMQKNGIRQALTAGADPIVQEARSRAPSAKIGRAIVKGSPRQNQDGTFSIRVYVDERKPDGFLGYFFENGVRPHLIARGASKQGRAALKAAASQGQKVGGVMKIGDEFVSGIISHPGVSARPFLLPALDIRAQDAVNAFAGKIRAFIEGKTGFSAPMDEAA